MEKRSAVFFSFVLALLLGLGGMVSLQASPVLAEDLPEVQVVDFLDVERFMGTWYLIAAIPSKFERQCDSGQTAEYTLLDDGTVHVDNSCYRTFGTVASRAGRAFVVDEETNAKLAVSFVRFFGVWPFRGSYWVVELGDDDDYGYVVIGHPTRDYGWIMSRTCERDSVPLEGIFERLADQFYDVSRFELIDQSRNGCPE
jgi:apolipoprotein D and lipocalin family protein